MFQLPDGAPDALRAACRPLGPLAVLLWSAGIAGIWVMPSALQRLALAGAIGATTGLFSCWSAAVRHDAERRALLHAIRELTRQDPPTGPLRAVS